MLIQYSKTETETLGLKVGRCNIDFFDPHQLKKELFNEKYDLCRVKVAAEDEFVVKRLEKLGLPYFFSGSIRRYKTPITKASDSNFLHAGLKFIPYEPHLDDLLFLMLKDTWGEYPIGYYRTPILENFCNKENEIKSVFNFYKEHNNYKLYPKNSIQFIEHNGSFVGFFALNTVNNHLESHIGGILKEYQKEGYFFDMLAYIKNYCLENNLTDFVFGARNENAKVQNIFQNAGFIPTGSENVFHVVPLISKVLTKGQKTQVQEKINLKKLKKAFYLSNNELRPIENTIFKEYIVNNIKFLYNFHLKNKFINGWVLEY